MRANEVPGDGVPLEHCSKGLGPYGQIVAACLCYFDVLRMVATREGKDKLEWIEEWRLLFHRLNCHFEKECNELTAEFRPLELEGRRGRVIVLRRGTERKLH